jgi:Tfp pilus assembly protein PilW
VILRGSRSSAGFTLVELLIGATLSAAVMAAVLSSYIFVGRNLARLANQQVLETEGRRTLAYFARDIRLASGLSGTPSATSVTLSQPTSTGTTTVAYSYNSGAGTLTRTPASGTAQVLLRNITASGLTIRYYDTSGNPYTTYVDYLSGIKQISLEFSTQLGTAGNGTQTKVYELATNRLILRNRSLLP